MEINKATEMHERKSLKNVAKKAKVGKSYRGETHENFRGEWFQSPDARRDQIIGTVDWVDFGLPLIESLEPSSEWPIQMPPALLGNWGCALFSKTGCQ